MSEFRNVAERRRWKALRDRLSEAQNHRCAYCGVRFGAEFKHWTWAHTKATIDHVIPRSQGGEDVWENLVAACLRCNDARKDEDAYTFWERKGWMTGKDRRLGDWLERAIRKSDPVPIHVALRRALERKAKAQGRTRRRAAGGVVAALQRQARFAVREAKRRGRAR